MIHHGQRLPLGLEPRHDLPGVHAQLDDLERHSSPHRLGLLRDIDHAAPALANSFQKFIAPERLAHRFIGCVGHRMAKLREALNLDRGLVELVPPKRNRRQHRVRLIMRREQRFETGAQGVVGTADGLEECRAFGGGLLDGQRKQGGLTFLRWWHG